MLDKDIAVLAAPKMRAAIKANAKALTPVRARVDVDARMEESVPVGPLIISRRRRPVPATVGALVVAVNVNALRYASAIRVRADLPVIAVRNTTAVLEGRNKYIT